MDKTKKETAEELIGVLNAISVVSRRLAQRLALLEKSKKGTTSNGRAAPD
ncbi:hypothetical protein FACS18949_15740 [Clostridia bacterium]|nr:hypothetical protein FACS18949_15740 [Clostridia bacterium]